MTWMEKEILETPDVIAKQAENATLAELSERFAQQPPSGLLTVGRGTSDHAADYLSYLLMRYRGLPCTSIPLSLNTVYQTDWQLTGQLVLSISQSGQPGSGGKREKLPSCWRIDRNPGQYRPVSAG